MSDPIEPIVKIGERLQEKANEIGLELLQFTVMPDFTGHGNHAVNAIFALPEEAMEQAELPAELAAIPELDDELAGILAATAEQEQEELRAAQRQADDEKMEEAKQRAIALREKLARKDKGFLDD